MVSFQQDYERPQTLTHYDDIVQNYRRKIFDVNAHSVMADTSRALE